MCYSWILLCSCKYTLQVHRVHKHIFPAVYMQPKPHSWLHRVCAQQQWQQRKKKKTKERKKKSVSLKDNYQQQGTNLPTTNSQLLSAPCIDNISTKHIYYTHIIHIEKNSFSLSHSLFSLCFYILQFLLEIRSHINKHRYIRSLQVTCDEVAKWKETLEWCWNEKRGDDKIEKNNNHTLMMITRTTTTISTQKNCRPIFIA